MKKILLLLPFLLLPYTWCAAQAAEPTGTGSVPDKKWLGAVDIGYLYGNARRSDQLYSSAYPTVQVFYGYRPNRLLAIGATTGADFYDNTLVVPVALGIRGEVFKTRISPTYSLDAGYGSAALSDGDTSKGGWMYHPALGMRVNTGNGTAFTFGAGYKVQRVQRETSSWNTLIDQKITYKRLSLRAGFMF
ncbi:hypothetical protein OB13_20160 [Pontibacter sp. HJ8]